MKRHSLFRAAALGIITLATLAMDSTAQSTVVSPDSSFSFELPERLVPMQINPQATLQFGDSAEESFFMVIPDVKADMFGWNLVRHSRVTVAQVLASTDFPELAGPVPMELDGYPAVQHTVDGAVQGAQIAFVHTSIDLPEQFVQVLMWTVRSQKDARRAEFDGILQSFRRLGGAGAAAADVYSVVPGSWAWTDEDACRGRIQTFEISAGRDSMTIHHSEPYEAPDGEMRSRTEYVIEGHSPTTLHTYIIDETRLTDTGEPVKWDLVVVARNRLAWHRTDWPAGALTDALRRCKASAD